MSESPTRAAGPDWLAPVTLTGRYVELRPLREADTDELTAAAAGDDEVWRWMPVATPRTRDDMAGLVRLLLAKNATGEFRSFAVRLLAEDRVVGQTSYYDLAPEHRALEIGWTFYGRAWWRTAVNTEAKLLLLAHAFETLGAQRVALRTDHLNRRSQAAIERIGGVREGTLRAHRVRPDGTTRDTVYFSVVAAEWPAARDRLRRRLDGGLRPDG